MEKSNEIVQLNKKDTFLRIKINDTFEFFVIDDVKQFEYFDALLSKRWNFNEDNETIQEIDMKPVLPFECKHLQLLILIVNNELPIENAMIDDDIISIIYCADFL